MVTTKQVIALAEKKSKEIAKQKIKDKKDKKEAREDKAEWKAFIRSEDRKAAAVEKAKVDKKKITTRDRAKRKLKRDRILYKPRGNLKKGAIAKGISSLVSSFMNNNTRAVYRAPVKRQTNVVQSRPATETRTYPQENTQQVAPSFSQMNIKQLQATPNVRALLTPAERAEIDNINPVMRRFRAMQILRKRLKEKQTAQRNATPRIIRQVDPFNSNRVIEKKEIPTERWLM